MRLEIGGDGVAYRDEALHVVFAQSVDLAQAEAQRKGLRAAATELSCPAKARHSSHRADLRSERMPWSERAVKPGDDSV